jgi:hypothetical protein
VWLLQDRRILKLFRTKRWLSGAALYPYSLRFARNARRLASLGIPSVTVERVAWCPTQRRHLVIYPMLPGTSLEQLLAGGQRDDALRAFAELVARLHDLGVLFRGLHAGNVLLLPDGRMALIDVGDMRFQGRPLRVSQRRRNFLHIVRRPSHRHLLQASGFQDLLHWYCEAAGDAARGLRINWPDLD